MRLFICGSAATWIIKEILENTGGLHNRVTCQIRLEPLDLLETRTYFLEGGCREGKMDLPSSQILELYMAIGGIPAYLSQIQPQLSAAQNIGQLFFGSQATLRNEFNRLFKSLFQKSDAHQNIVRALSSKRIGLTRDEISKITQISSGGVLSNYLRELEESGFIEGFVPYLKQKNDKMYRLIDEFSWFHLKWIESAPQASFLGNGIDYWISQSHLPSFKAWSGYSFETICLKHILKIQAALKASKISCKFGPWTYMKKDSKKIKSLPKESQGAQIDLVIDREDGVINLLEMKYSTQPYSLSTSEARAILNKVAIFSEQTKTQKHILPVLVSPFGLKHGPWDEEVFKGGIVTLNSFFQ